MGIIQVDYEVGQEVWKLFRTSSSDWTHNLNTILHWSSSLFEEIYLTEMKQQGTGIMVLYNLWEDDPGQLELDFDADQYDSQIRGANLDEKTIMLALHYPNSMHYLTYHTLYGGKEFLWFLSYVAILYLQLPPDFKIILQGHEVQHHRLVDDPICPHELTCRPRGGVEHVMTEVIIMLPFWNIWNCTGSDGQGIVGVLEVNFVQPAHDKQGIECTTMLAQWIFVPIRAVRRVHHLHLQGEWGETTRRWVCTPSILSPVSPEESTRFLGDARIGTRRVALDGRVLLTYREHSLTKSHHDDVEPTAAISRIGSLSRTAGE
ncbi:unnamed protein product [Sphagnum compactum]